jgi:protein-disulfide isomerase
MKILNLTWQMRRTCYSQIHRENDVQPGAEIPGSRNRRLVALAVWLLLSVAMAPTGASAQTAAAAQPTNPKPDSAQIDQVIQQYILDHPEVVVESVRRYGERLKLAQQQHKQEAVEQHAAELYKDAASPVAESAQSSDDSVTIVEFFDYRCGYCRKTEDSVAQFAGKPGVRIIYKELPILGPESLMAAEAALAAVNQGGYEKFHHALLTSPTPVTSESIEKIAADSGLDVARLKKDMAAPEIKAEIARNSELADKLGVQATPTFVIGQKIQSGGLSPQQLQSLIDDAKPKLAVAQGRASGGQ